MEQLQTQNVQVEEINHFLTSISTQPLFIIIVIVFGAVIVPLIEEFLKPLGIWFLKKHSLTPQSGFIAGVLCGSGYALFESLLLTSSEGEWNLVVMARLGTGIIHIYTTGLMGWALVRAWKKSQYRNLIMAYFLAVFIHGLWNCLAILSVFGVLSNSPAPDAFTRFLQRISNIAPLSIIVLLLGSFIILLISNRSLQKISNI